MEKFSLGIIEMQLDLGDEDIVYAKRMEIIRNRMSLLQMQMQHMNYKIEIGEMELEKLQKQQ